MLLLIGNTMWANAQNAGQQPSWIPDSVDLAPLRISCDTDDPGVTDSTSARDAGQVDSDVPASCLNTRFVRANVHFVQNSGGGGNFGSVDNPVTTTIDENGYRWAQGLVWTCNWPPGGWAQNVKMNQLPSNQTPVLPKRIQLIMSGVYFDRVTNGGYQYGTPFRPKCCSF